MNSPTYRPLTERADAMLDTASQATRRAIEGAGQVAHQSFDAMSGSVDRAQHRAGPALHDLAASAEDFARGSAAAVAERARHARDVSAGFVREHPAQALLMAAAGGAALVLLARLVARNGRPGRGY